MVEDALVEKLTKRNEELTKELERRDAETKTNWKMSCAIDWLLGNLLFFGLLITAKGIIMPANKPHSVKAVARFKMLLIMIRK